MKLELLIKIVTLMLVITFFLIRSTFIKHYKKFTSRTLIKYVIFLVLFSFYFLGYFDFAKLNFNFYIQIIGVIIILAGFSLLFWAHKHLGINWSPIIEKRFSKSRGLVKLGPYKFIRHPIYSASFIALVGFFFLSANWILVGIPLLILLAFYSIKIPKEERELTENFGKKYIQYMKSTGGLLPKI